MYVFVCGSGYHHNKKRYRESLPTTSTEPSFRQLMKKQTLLLKNINDFIRCVRLCMLRMNGTQIMCDCAYI